MNADVRSQAAAIEPLPLTVPEAALRRLELRLSRSLASGEPLEASALYGVSWEPLRELLDHFSADFELEQQPLFGLPLFQADLAGERLRFVHARSSAPSAVPLLLLHGYSGSLAEFQYLIEPLARREPGVAASACHTVCPALDGASCARAAAETCAALMRALGYARYAVHGSDLGASVALELAALDRPRVMGLHVTAVPSYPGPAAPELASLTPVEKSQLARLSELRDELESQLPTSPIEELAFALTRIDDADAAPANQRLRDTLLTGLTLTWTLTDPTLREGLYRRRLDSAPPTFAPLVLHQFPLDAPTLRRFAEARHEIVELHAHERGGGMPALEQPDLLLESLRSFVEKLR